MSYPAHVHTQVEASAGGVATPPHRTRKPETRRGLRDGHWPRTWRNRSGVCAPTAARVTSSASPLRRARRLDVAHPRPQAACREGHQQLPHRSRAATYAVAASCHLVTRHVASENGGRQLGSAIRPLCQGKVGG